MAEYRISGIWKDDSNVITHYAVHSQNSEGKFLRAKKTSKVDAVALVEKTDSITYTWLWNYSTPSWQLGEKVGVVSGTNGKYLRSYPDNKLRDNLDNLIDYDWIRI